MLLVKRLSEFAVLPVRSTPGAAGYDLSSAKSVVIPARGKAICPTNLAITCPPGTYGRIAPRSGLAWRHHIDVGAGVCDGDYVGDVGVILFNHADTDYKVEVGDRVAQLILEKIKLVEVKEVDDLVQTQRGDGGFGSTGIKKHKSDMPKTTTVTACFKTLSAVGASLNIVAIHAQNMQDLLTQVQEFLKYDPNATFSDFIRTSTKCKVEMTLSSTLFPFQFRSNVPCVDCTE